MKIEKYLNDCKEKLPPELAKIFISEGRHYKRRKVEIQQHCWRIHQGGYQFGGD